MLAVVDQGVHFRPRRAARSTPPSKQKKILATLMTLLLGTLLSWVAGGLWGVGATQIVRLLRLGRIGSGILSTAGVGIVRVAVFILVVWLLEKKRLLPLLALPKRGQWRPVIAGLGIPCLSLPAVFFMGICLGWLVVGGWRWQLLPWPTVAGMLFVSLMLNFIVAISEELIFRGYLLKELDKAWSPAAALITSSVLFSLIHAPMIASASIALFGFGILLFTLFGILFGWTYRRTRSLWVPIAIHFAWNFLEEDLLNLGGNLSNPYLVGALTRLVGPTARSGLVNAALFTAIALVLTYASAGLAYRKKSLKS